jgi:pimeloyl-ACP methyl ester carboxylesterase
MLASPSRPHWRRLAGRGAQAVVLLLFVLSLLGLFLHNRLTPTRAAERPARITEQGAQLYEINGFGLWVLDVGPPSDPLPLIVLHGGPGQSSATLREALRFLETDHRVIYYDQRGAGRSEVKSDLSYYTVDQLVHELEILRRIVATTPRVRLLAHGFGGVIAQHYALSYPDRVESMILLSSLPAEGARYSTVLEYYDDLVRTLVRAGIPPEDPAAADEWYARYWHQSAVAMLGDPSHENLLPDLRGSFGPARALGVSLAAAARPLRLSRARLDTRTLLVYGQQEAPCGQGGGLGPMLLRFSNATLVTVPQSGYWSFLEEPALVRSLITGFLSTPVP